MKEIWRQFKKYRRWIIAFILVAAALYSIFHRLFGRPTPTTNPPPSPSLSTASPAPSPTPSLASSPSSSVTNIAAGHWQFTDFDINSQAFFYYDQGSSLFKRYDLKTGKITTISEALVYVDHAVWSPNHQQLILELNNSQGNLVDNPLYQTDVPGGQKVIGLYDLATKKFQRLNNAITAISFIDDATIIYQFSDGKNNNLSVAKPDGSGWKNIARLNSQVELRRAGATALVREKDKDTVSRYRADGRLVENIAIPHDLDLTGSAWQNSGRLALYATTVEPVNIQQLAANSVQTLVTLPHRPADLAVLWDNKTGDIYLASFDGLQKLDSKATTP